MPPRLFAWVVSVSLLSLPSASAGQAPGASVRLDWVVPGGEGCPTRDEMQAGVEARLGRAVFEAPEEGARFVITAELTRETPGAPWSARVTLLDPSGRSLGERVVRGRDPDCQGLRDTLALILSLLVEQHRERIVLYEPPPPPIPAATPAEPPPPAAPPDAPPDAPPPAGPSVELQLGGTLRGVALPGPGFGVRQVIEVGWRGVPFTVAVAADLTPPFLYASDAASIALWYWSAELTGCPVLFDDPALRLITCAGVAAGQVFARGENLDVSRSAEDLRVDVVTRVGASVALAGPLRLIVTALVDVPLVRPVYTYGADGGGVLYESVPLSLGVSLALGLRFGSS